MMIIALIFVLFTQKATSVKEVYDSPCPDIFQYYLLEDVLYGRVTIPPQQFGTEVKLRFQMSIPEKLDLSKSGGAGKIEAEGGNLNTLDKVLCSVPITYKIHFPKNVRPKMTKIILNDMILCGSPPHGFSPDVDVVTDIWLYINVNTVNQTGDRTFCHEIIKPGNNDPSTSAPPPSYIPHVINRNNFENCGVSKLSNSLIRYGQATAKGIWPWIVAIYKVVAYNRKFICSGTLISERHIVTSGMCMVNKNVRQLKARLGVFNIDNWEENESSVSAISSVRFNPGFSLSTLKNNIAILILKTRTTFTDYIIPACLWRSDPNPNFINGRTGMAVGWGEDEYGHELTKEPRVIKMPLYRDVTCKANSRSFYNIADNMTLCAGNRDGSGPCNRDSGDGVYVAENDQWTLRGIVSLILLVNKSKSTCDLNDYVILIDVAKYLPWIESTINEM